MLCFFGIPGVGAIVRGRRGLPAHVATCAGCRNTCTAEAVECTVIGGDADCDGTPDNTAFGDQDGDGLTNESDPDMDGDGMPNAQDSDNDNDGMPDAMDTSPNGDEGGNADDRDGDGVPNSEDVSTPDDGTETGGGETDGDGRSGDRRWGSRLRVAPCDIGAAFL